jgi:hypothetical protein
MSIRQRWLVAIVAVALGCGALAIDPHREGAVWRQQRGAVEAELAVRMAAPGPAPGLAAATYDVVLTGPPLLEVTALRLEDAAAGWKIARQSSAWSEANGHAAIEFLLTLHQVKREEPLPNLHISFRESPEAPIEKLEWLDLLRSVVPGPGPPAPEEPQSSHWVLPAVAIAVALIAIAAALVLWRRRRTAVAVEPWVRALAEINRLETEGLGKAPAMYHTRVSQVVRSYVAERFGLHALEQTTAEFLAATGAIPELAAHGETLRAFCERCDVAKFADAAMTPEDCRCSGELARALIESTRPILPPGTPSQPVDLALADGSPARKRRLLR